MMTTNTNIMEQTEFTRLTELHRPRIYRQAMILTNGDHAEADDLTQETLVRAFRNIEVFNRDQSFLNWTLKILQRLFLDLKRKQGRRIQSMSFDEMVNDEEVETLDVEDPHADVLQDILTAEQAVELNNYFQLLPSIYSQVLVLHYMQDMTFEEIAKVQGTGVGTVRSRKHRAIAMLQQHIQEHEFVTTQM